MLVDSAGNNRPVEVDIDRRVNLGVNLHPVYQSPSHVRRELVKKELDDKKDSQMEIEEKLRLKENN